MQPHALLRKIHQLPLIPIHRPPQPPKRMPIIPYQRPQHPFQPAIPIQPPPPPLLQRGRQIPLPTRQVQHLEAGELVQLGPAQRRAGHAGGVDRVQQVEQGRVVRLPGLGQDRRVDDEDVRFPREFVGPRGGDDGFAQFAHCLEDQGEFGLAGVAAAAAAAAAAA